MRLTQETPFTDDGVLQVAAWAGWLARKSPANKAKQPASFVGLIFFALDTWARLPMKLLRMPAMPSIFDIVRFICCYLLGCWVEPLIAPGRRRSRLLWHNGVLKRLKIYYLFEFLKIACGIWLDEKSLNPHLSLLPSVLYVAGSSLGKALDQHSWGIMIKTEATRRASEAHAIGLSRLKGPIKRLLIYSSVLWVNSDCSMFALSSRAWFTGSWYLKSCAFSE